MADIWIPGYRRLELGPSGGPYDDTRNPKGCLHTTEGSSLLGAETAYYHYPPHIGYDPKTRAKHQYIPLNRHSYAFRGSESDDEYIIQVEIVGFARETHLWSNTLYRNIAIDVLKPLEEYIGIPRRALKFYGEGDGIVLAEPESPVRLSPESLRNYRGWLGHQHIPRPDAHWDPGKFLIQKSFVYLPSVEDKDDEVKPLLCRDNKQREGYKGIHAVTPVGHWKITSEQELNNFCHRWGISTKPMACDDVEWWGPDFTDRIKRV